MTRLSSKATFFYKRVFPVLFIGFIVVFIAVPLLRAAEIGSFPPLSFLVVPVVMLFIFLFVMKKLVFDLVDEVVDQGDYLLVKNGGHEDRIALSDIMNINYQSMMSPPRVTLSLRQPSAFGSQVSFCAPLRLLPFSTSPVIDKLIARVDAARQTGRR
jgi:hypothetical protein